MSVSNSGARWSMSVAGYTQRMLLGISRQQSAPAWSRTADDWLWVLTRDGNSQLYLVNNDGSELRRITFSEAIDTEPFFSPDGKAMLFTSDRGGSAQIYRVAVGGRQWRTVDLRGQQQLFSRFSPDGKSFVYSHFDGGKFYIASRIREQADADIDLGWMGEDKRVSPPTASSSCWSSRRSWYIGDRFQRRKVKQKMVAQYGDIREPTWVLSRNNDFKR